MRFSLRDLSLRGRIAGVAGVAVAVAVLLGAGLAYVAIRAELRGEVDNALRDTASRFVRLDSGAADPGPGGPAGPAGGGVLFGPKGPPGYRDFHRRAPAFGGAAGYVQVVAPDGSVLRPPDETGELPAGAAARAVAATGTGQRLDDAHVGGNHLRVLTIGAGDIGAVQIARPLAEVDRVLNRVLFILILMAAGGIAAGAALGFGVARAALAPIRRFTSGTEQIAAEKDVSRRMDVHGEDELARLARSFNATLDELERSVDAQRQLVADAGHELRTPIASLRANIQVLEEADRLPEADRVALRNDIVGELDELTALVADVVELARGTKGGDGEVDDVRLDLIVESLIERARRRAGDDVTFDVDLQPALVTGQPDRISRAVSNLLDNARKWSPPGGLIEVRLRDGELSVRDHGPGFEDKDLPHVFDRFFRSDRARAMPGSGLGLAIVRQAAEAHGGSVKAANAPGGGAVVRVSFGPPQLAEALTQVIRES
jgi:two-component system, OmpR family, sensor histidine kinase MprB